MFGISEPTPKVSFPLLAAVKTHGFRVYSVSFLPVSLCRLMPSASIFDVCTVFGSVPGTPSTLSRWQRYKAEGRMCVRGLKPTRQTKEMNMIW